MFAGRGRQMMCVAGRPTVLYFMLLCVAVMTSWESGLLEQEVLEHDGAGVLPVAASRIAMRCHSFRCPILGCTRCRDWTYGCTGCGRKVYCFCEPSRLAVWLMQRFLTGDKAAGTWRYPCTCGLCRSSAESNDNATVMAWTAVSLGRQLVKTGWLFKTSQQFNLLAPELFF